jgi:LacI family transcriptional regulator
MSRVRHVAVIYDAKLPYDVKVVTGIAAYAQQVANWSIYIEENALQAQRLPDLSRWRADGVLADLDDPHVARQVRASGTPVVAFGGGYGWHAPQWPVPYFRTDNAAVARLGAQHLRDRGFRQFAFCGYPASRINGWSAERQSAFAETVRRAGYRCHAYRASRPSERHWSVLCDRLGRWLRGLPKPVGVMAANDKRARQVLEACRLAGLRVPEDVAVVGVDNDEMLCQLSSPSLTSVEQGARRLGYEAAHLLDRLMRGARPRRLRYVIPPEGIVTRASTDGLAITDPDVAAAAQLIRQRSGEGLRVADVMDSVAVSRSTLEKRFNKALGRSVFAEIRRVQLEMSRNLLATSSLPVKQVAVRAGFRSVQHMTTLFAKAFGQTPAHYRRQAALGGHGAQ